MLSREAILAAFGFSSGKLSKECEQLYYDLSFYSAAFCEGYLSRKDKRLSDMFWELEAFANPTQTSGKIDWANKGYAFAKSPTVELQQTKEEVMLRLAPLFDRMSL